MATRENLQFGMNELQIEQMERNLNHMNQKNSLKALKKQEKFLEQNKWEIQKMMDSGVFKLNLQNNKEKEDNKRIALKVIDLKPPFIKDKEFSMSKDMNVLNFKNPKNGMEIRAK